MDSLEASREPRNRDGFGLRVVQVVCGGIALALLVGLLLPALQSTNRRRFHTCKNNLKQIGLALQNYEDKFRCFPPACTFDEAGRPAHSWRVLILPFLQDPNASDVYERYQFDEPWNSVNNRKLARAMPRVFQCPDCTAGDNETNYLAVIGEESIWPEDCPVSSRDIHDGMSKTIAVVETNDSGINWMEPRDLRIAQASHGMNPPNVKPGISSGHPGGATLLFCDTHPEFLPDSTRSDLLHALLTRSGDERLSYDDQTGARKLLPTTPAVQQQ